MWIGQNLNQYFVGQIKRKKILGDRHMVCASIPWQADQGGFNKNLKIKEPKKQMLTKLFSPPQ